MAATSKRKNPAAVALSKRRLVTMTAEERSAVARNSVQARWRKARGDQPKRWHVLVAMDDPNHPQIIDSDIDRKKLLQRTRARPDCWISEDGTLGRMTFIDYIEYDPSGFTVSTIFKRDPARQIKALKTLAGAVGQPREPS